MALISDILQNFGAHGGERSYSRTRGVFVD